MRWRKRTPQDQDAQPRLTPEEREAERRRQASARAIEDAVRRDGVWFPPSHHGSRFPTRGE